MSFVYFLGQREREREIRDREIRETCSFMEKRNSAGEITLNFSIDSCVRDYRYFVMRRRLMGLELENQSTQNMWDEVNNLFSIYLTLPAALGL
jgi:hypothetical protein